MFQEAFVDGLMGGQLFDDLFFEDVDGPKLNQLPQMVEAFELYKSKFCKICEELVSFGLKEGQNREKERSMFLAAVNKAKEADKAQGVAVINEFLAYKKKVIIFKNLTLSFFIVKVLVDCTYADKEKHGFNVPKITNFSGIDGAGPGE